MLYEGLHLICFRCGNFGHRKDEDGVMEPNNNDQRREGKVMLVRNTLSKKQVVAKDDNFGEWMLPQRQI